jgi:predicted phosphodiesterase
MRYNKFNTRTGLALQAMFEIHQPEVWLFGHWHINKVQKIGATNFICLAELSFIDIGD